MSNHMERVIAWQSTKPITVRVIKKPELPSAFGWTDAQYDAAMCALFNP